MHWKPGVLTQSAHGLAVGQRSNKGNEEGRPGNSEENPNGDSHRLLDRCNSPNRDAHGGLDSCKCNNVHQDPNEVVLNGFGLLPRIEIFVHSTEASETAVYCKTCDGDVCDLGGDVSIALVTESLVMNIPCQQP